MFTKSPSSFDPFGSWDMKELLPTMPIDWLDMAISNEISRSSLLQDLK